MTEKQEKQYEDIRNKSNERVIGKTFGRLFVDSYIRTGKNYHKYFKCVCMCGEIVEVDMKHLLYGNIVSCGCYWEDHKREFRKSHGASYISLYTRWTCIKQRCKNKNNARYKDYGGRGIDLCDEWEVYENFEKWAKINGYTESLQIDRIDNNKGYYPDNCHWVTSKINNQNKRCNINITHDGETKTVSQWASIYKINANTILARINILGWDHERAIITKVKNEK